MKKSVVLLAAGLMVSSALYAQVRLGLKGGLNFSDMKYEPKDETHGTPDANSLASYHAGVILDVGLADQFAVQTGALLSSKGSKVEYNNALGNFTNTINPIYIEVPVNFLVKPRIADGLRLYMGLGPYIGFGVSGKSKFSGDDTPVGDLYTDHNLKFGNDSGDDLKQEDIGGNILAGLEFDSGFIIGAQYGLSFTNNAPNGDDNASKILRNRVFSISIGYLFSNY